MSNSKLDSNPNPAEVETVKVKMDDGTVVEFQMTSDEIVRRSCGIFFTCPDNQVGKRIIEFKSIGGDGEERKAVSAWGKPHRSITAGVHPDQAAEFTDAARKSGNTGVHYCRKTGQLVSESPGALKKELARRGMTNFGSGYGNV